MSSASSYLKAHRKSMKQITDKYTVAELKRINAGLGSKVSGNKKELAYRLLNLGYPL